MEPASFTTDTIWIIAAIIAFIIIDIIIIAVFAKFKNTQKDTPKRPSAKDLFFKDKKPSGAESVFAVLKMLTLKKIDLTSLDLSLIIDESLSASDQENLLKELQEYSSIQAVKKDSANNFDCIAIHQNGQKMRAKLTMNQDKINKFEPYGPVDNF